MARALAGALLFSLPLLMTMELWHIAVAVDRWRLVLLALATIGLTVGLTRNFGATTANGRWSRALVDAGVAILAGVVAAAAVLTLFQVVNPVQDLGGAISVITVEALPASLGAAYARGQLGQSSPRLEPRYGHELFLMLAGAVVFAANVAPTQEVVLLAAFMGQISAVLLVVLSLVLMHGLVYASGFSGQEERKGGRRRAFLSFTVPGYVLALAASAFMLWTFGRYDGTGALVGLVEAIVLAFPAALGAGAARLIL